MTMNDAAKHGLGAAPEPTTEITLDELEEANGGILPVIAFVGRQLAWEGALWAIGRLTKKK